VTGARAVLVTGGGTGIGAAVARQLAGAGSKVAICGRRPEPLRAVAAETGALDITCDIARADDVERLVATAARELGGLDGLVLNAGVIAPGGVADLDPADFAEMVAVNLTGAFLVARAALPYLLERRGAVVAVASVAALRAASGMAGYAATKAGLAMLTQSLAVDHAHEGLRANVICPGWTVTEMADAEMTAFGAERGLSAEAAYSLVTALVPARRAASAAEVAGVVCWLLSDASSYLNGAVIPVDGAACAVDVGTIAFDPRVSLAGPG
jgi:meso-butanediol dehydrogenase/(S,S)-butanediol dehydrogenase/diacetyl reductase